MEGFVRVRRRELGSLEVRIMVEGETGKMGEGMVGAVLTGEG